MIKLDYGVGGQRVFDKFKKSEIFKHWLNFYNLREEDKQYLTIHCDALMKKDKSIALSTQAPNNPNDKKTKNIIDAYEYLASTNFYEMPPLKDIIFELKHAINDAVSTKDMQNTEKANDEMWLSFIKEIQKPEIQLLLKSFGQYSLANSTFGWKLAQENIFRVRSQKPDATFLQTRLQWRDKFRRNVLPNAQKVVILIPFIDSKQPNGDDLQQTMKLSGYKDDDKYNDLSKQQKDYVYITARGDDASSYRYVAYYDVSDTVLIDPNGPDIWAEEVGFDNNLTGHLNQAALDYKATHGANGSSSEDIAKIYNNEEGDVKALATALAQGIQNTYQEIPTLLPKTNNKNAYVKCYIDMIEALSDKLIEEHSKIVRQENRKLGVSIASTIVLCMTKVSPETVAKKLANDQLTDQSYFELRNVVNTILKLINRNLPKQESKSINEMEIPTLNSVDELLSMIGMTRKDVKPTNMTDEESFLENRTSNKEAIKENFYNLFNRINNIKLYE